LGQCVTPAGQKNIFEPLSKCNTGMAMLRTGLAVTKQTKQNKQTDKQTNKK